MKRYIERIKQHQEKQVIALPTIFDLPEIIECNRSKGKYFNVIFFWMYIIVLPTMLFITLLVFIEILLKEHKENKLHVKS